MEKERYKSGFYWVIARDSRGVPDEVWTVAEFSGGLWLFIGSDMYHSIDDIEKIGAMIDRPS